MMTVRAAMLMLGAMSCWACCTAASAWEITLTGELTTRASVVRLADIAVVCDIDDAEFQENLKAMIVAAGPTRSHTRELSSSDVRRMVEQRGLDMSQGQFTGASRVVITYGEAETAVSGNSIRRFGTPNSRLRRVMERAGQNHATVAAAGVPDDGAADPPTSLAVVVAVRELRKGQPIRQDDVTVISVREQELPADAVGCLEDVVGQVAARAILTDEPLTTRMLTKPLLVRSRDQVTVGVCCGGIVVTQHGIAQNDGALGDTVVVSAMDDKKIRLNAQVVDVRKVVVMADSFSVSDQRR